MSVFRSLMMANAAVDPLKQPLTFTAEEAGATVALNTVGTLTIPGMHYRMGKSGLWLPYTAGTVIDLPNIGDSCQFWNSDSTLSINGSNYANFLIPKKVSATGNIQSLLNWSNTLHEYCFCYLFYAAGNGGVTCTPYMPAKTLVKGCYYYMFFYTPNLKKAEFMAETLATQSCGGMFQSCWSLKERRVHFTEWHANATGSWGFNAPSTGTFYKPSALPEEYGTSRIPEGWTVVNID